MTAARPRRLAPAGTATAWRATGRLGPWLPLLGLVGAALVLAATYGVTRPSGGPVGWTPPPPFRWVARVTGLSAAPHGVLEGLSVAAWLVLGVAFLLACREAWAGRLSVRAVLLSAISLQILAMLAVPARPSSDIYLYSIYGRTVSLYHRNPYLVAPRMVASDPLFRLIVPQVRNLTSPYGPAFIRLAAVLTRMLRSASQLVLAFKALALAASLITVLVIRQLAAWIRPRRAAFAVALFGLNPAVVMVGVGGGHNDALAGLAVALGLALIVVRWDRAQGQRWITEMAGTAVLTMGSLIKFPVAIVLVLSILVCSLRADGRRAFWAAMHLLVVGALVLVVAFPFLQMRNPTLGASTLSRSGGVLAPTSFLWSIGSSVASRGGGSGAVSWLVPMLLSAFLLCVFLALLIQIGGMSAVRALARACPEFLLSACGWTLLLFLLAAPQVWPWYFLWILPLAWVLPSIARVGIGVISAMLPVPLVMAGMTLPHELIRDFQLYVIAPVLLAYFAVLLVDFQRRVRTGMAASGDRPPPPAAAGSDELPLARSRRGGGA